VSTFGLIYAPGRYRDNEEMRTEKRAFTFLPHRVTPTANVSLKFAILVLRFLGPSYCESLTDVTRCMRSALFLALGSIPLTAPVSRDNMDRG
jgi:hypothetical protein